VIEERRKTTTTAKNSALHCFAWLSFSSAFAGRRPIAAAETAHGRKSCWRKRRGVASCSIFDHAVLHTSVFLHAAMRRSAITGLVLGLLLVVGCAVPGTSDTLRV
jgi:hypothetical protein